MVHACIEFADLRLRTTTVVGSARMGYVALIDRSGGPPPLVDRSPLCPIPNGPLRASECGGLSRLGIRIGWRLAWEGHQETRNRGRSGRGNECPRVIFGVRKARSLSLLAARPSEKDRRRRESSSFPLGLGRRVFGIVSKRAGADFDWSGSHTAMMRFKSSIERVSNRLRVA